MKKIAGAMALGVVLAAGSITAAEAAPKAFKVTVKVSKSTADVGAKIKVSGKVSGQSSKSLKGKKVTVQRKYGNGGWQKVGTAKISSKRTFALSTTLVKGGNTSFRVVKGKSGKIKSGTSAARSLPVYKWIDLTTAPSIGYSMGVRNQAVTMGGKRYARALQGVDQLMVAFNATNCTALTTTIGFQDRDRSKMDRTDTQSLVAMSGNAPGAQPTGQYGPYIVSRDQVQKVSIGFANVVTVMAVAETEVSAGSFVASAVMADPLVRCNSDSLAAVPESWLTTGPA